MVSAQMGGTKFALRLLVTVVIRPNKAYVWTVLELPQIPVCLELKSFAGRMLLLYQRAEWCLLFWDERDVIQGARNKKTIFLISLLHLRYHVLKSIITLQMKKRPKTNPSRLHLYY